MLLYYFKCRKVQKEKNPKLASTKNGRIMLLSKCVVCDSKKWKFIIEEEASRLSSSLGLRTLLSKISLVITLLF